MDRRLQAHVLQNILNNGGWIWGGEREILDNPAALVHFEDSGFSSVDYYQCTVMLTESSQIVAQDLERYGYSDYALYSPFCLTLDGVQHLKDLQRPVREWLKRNWFATVVAITTSLAAVTAAAFNVVLQIIG